MGQSGSTNVFVHLTLSSGPSSPMETQSLSVMDECATFSHKEKNTHARFELLFHQPIVKGNMVVLNKSLAMLQLHITTVASLLPSAVLLLAKKGS